MMLPYTDRDFTTAERKAAATKGKVATRSDGDCVLAPVANGTYEVWREPFGPTSGYEDEYGRYGHRVRIAPARR